MSETATKSEQVNLGFRIPIEIAKEIENLVKSNRYKNKTDVVVTALRLLIHQEKPIIEASKKY